MGSAPSAGRLSASTQEANTQTDPHPAFPPLWSLGFQTPPIQGLPPKAGWCVDAQRDRTAKILRRSSSATICRPDASQTSPTFALNQAFPTESRPTKRMPADEDGGESANPSRRERFHQTASAADIPKKGPSCCLQSSQSPTLAPAGLSATAEEFVRELLE